MRALAFLVLLTGCLSATSAACAAGIDSQVSGLDLKTCTATHVVKEAEDGTPLKRKDWTADTWRCTGLAGWNVFVAEADLRPAIAFTRGAKFDGPWQSFPKFAATGLHVEWRGPTIAGRFTPVAAILRFDWAVDDDRGSVLAVARLDRDPVKTCLFAYVDATANKNADAIADDLADHKAAAASCPTEGGQPEFVGKVSEALK